MPPKRSAKSRKSETEMSTAGGFDGIQLESKQISTLILMLKGDEGQIVQNSVEALYRYADKSTENKTQLFSLKSLDLLFSLLIENNESRYNDNNRLIKRYAAMTIGVMSSVVEVKKAIKLKREWLQSLTNILHEAAETSSIDPVITEFVCLIISNLSQEFTGKVALAKATDDPSILPAALVKLLQSSDPDICYNAATSLKNLAIDFENLAIIRSQNNIEEYLLDLLSSRYPLIQKTVLTLLVNISQETKSAEKIGELEGVRKLIDIIGNDKISDLHESSLHVLSNLFRVHKLLAEARNQGALLRLLQLQGKEPGKNANEVGAIEPAIMAALATAFENIAVDKVNADILVDEKIDATLINYLNFDENNVKACAVFAVATLAKNVFFKETFAQNGIELLAKLLESDHEKCLEGALLALSVLMLNCSGNIELAVRHNAIEFICNSLTHESECVVINALAALRSASLDSTARASALRTGLFREGIKSLLMHDSSEIKLATAKTMTCYWKGFFFLFFHIGTADLGRNKMRKKVHF